MKLDIVAFLCSKHVSFSSEYIDFFFELPIDMRNRLLASKRSDSFVKKKKLSLTELVSSIHGVHSLYTGKLKTDSLWVNIEYMEDDDVFCMFRICNRDNVSLFVIIDTILLDKPFLRLVTPSPLHLTTISCNDNLDDVLTFLIEKNYDVNSIHPESGNNCILSILSLPRQTVDYGITQKTLEIILHKTRNLNHTNKAVENALCLCIVNNHKNVFKSILESNPDTLLVNACVTSDNISLINLCIVYNRIGFFEALLNHKAFAINDTNNHLLFTSIILDRGGFIESFLRIKQDTDQEGVRNCLSIGNTFNIVIFVLVYDFYSYQNRFLSNNGVYANLHRHMPNSLNILISIYDFIENEKMDGYILLLLESGFCTESKDHPWGNTPLLNAIVRQHTKAIELLLQFNANINHMNDAGETAISLVVKQNNMHCLKLLRMHGVDVNVCYKDLDMAQYALVSNSTDSFYNIISPFRSVFFNPVYSGDTCPVCRVLNSSKSSYENDKGAIQTFVTYVVKHVSSSLIKMSYFRYKNRQITACLSQRIGRDILEYMMLFIEFKRKATFESICDLRKHVIKHHAI